MDHYQFHHQYQHQQQHQNTQGSMHAYAYAYSTAATTTLANDDTGALAMRNQQQQQQQQQQQPSPFGYNLQSSTSPILNMRASPSALASASQMNTSMSHLSLSHHGNQSHNVNHSGNPNVKLNGNMPSMSTSHGNSNTSSLFSSPAYMPLTTQASASLRALDSEESEDDGSGGSAGIYTLHGNIHQEHQQQARHRSQQSSLNKIEEQLESMTLSMPMSMSGNMSVNMRTMSTSSSAASPSMAARKGEKIIPNPTMTSSASSTSLNLKISGSLSVSSAAAKGLTECQQYLRSGKCQYGENCRYVHVSRVVSPALSNSPSKLELDDKSSVASSSSSSSSSSHANANVNANANTTVYPVRPGMPECQYYLKTGKCNYASRCKFDHPPRDERLVNSLNRRDCFDFVQTGSCPYKEKCKYNHPVEFRLGGLAASNGANASSSSLSQSQSQSQSQIQTQSQSLGSSPKKSADSQATSLAAPVRKESSTGNVWGEHARERLLAAAVSQSPCIQNPSRAAQEEAAINIPSAKVSLADPLPVESLREDSSAEQGFASSSIAAASVFDMSPADSSFDYSEQQQQHFHNLASLFRDQQHQHQHQRQQHQQHQQISLQDPVGFSERTHSIPIRSYQAGGSAFAALNSNPDARRFTTSADDFDVYMPTIMPQQAANLQSLLGPAHSLDETNFQARFSGSPEFPGGSYMMSQGNGMMFPNAYAVPVESQSQNDQPQFRDYCLFQTKHQYSPSTSACMFP